MKLLKQVKEWFWSLSHDHRCETLNAREGAAKGGSADSTALPRQIRWLFSGLVLNHCLGGPSSPPRHPLTPSALYLSCQMIPTTAFSSQALVAAAVLVVTSALYCMWSSNSKKWDPRGKVIFVRLPPQLSSPKIHL